MNRSTATLVALFLAALTLRPQIVGVGPLIPSIQDAFGTSHAVVGLLGTIPVLCMGLFAPVAAYLAAKIGTRRAMTIGLALIGIVRHPPGDDAVGLARRPPHLAGRHRHGARQRARPDLGQGAFRGPAGDGHGRLHDRDPDRLDERGRGSPCRWRRWLGGWRGALIAISCVALLSLVAWVVLTRGDEPHAAPAATVPRLPVAQSDGLAARRDLRADGLWRTTASTPGSPMRTPSAAGATGEAGVLLAMMNLTAIPSSFLVPWALRPDRPAQPVPARAEPGLHHRRDDARRGTGLRVRRRAARRRRAGRPLRARDDACRSTSSGRQRRSGRSSR